MNETMNRNDNTDESNFDEVATENLEDDEPEFEFVTVSDTEKSSIASKSPYIQHLIDITKLELLQPAAVRLGYASNELGLFHLFMRRSMFQSIRKWTNAELEKKATILFLQKNFMPMLVLKLQCRS